MVQMIISLGDLSVISENGPPYYDGSMHQIFALPHFSNEKGTVIKKLVFLIGTGFTYNFIYQGLCRLKFYLKKYKF